MGAHVSAAGGVELAPERATRISAVNLQLFTKQPSRWAEPELTPVRVAAFREARSAARIGFAAAHDSYLINLASPDPALWSRSLECFRAELERGADLGLDAMVTHPGNATDGDLASGIARNAEAVTRALDACPPGPRVLLELTAGAGTSVGGTFEHLVAIIEAVPAPCRERLGVCFDTCHAYAGGYDLVRDYNGVWRSFEDTLSVARLALFHMNDSKHPMGSHRDQHEMIGEGALGELPFQRIMNDPRFNDIPKLLETPKGDDVVANDRRNLALLRSYRGESRATDH